MFLLGILLIKNWYRSKEDLINQILELLELTSIEIEAIKKNRAQVIRISQGKK